MIVRDATTRVNFSPAILTWSIGAIPAMRDESVIEDFDHPIGWCTHGLRNRQC
jgi:hypothetical protein